RDIFNLRGLLNPVTYNDPRIAFYGKRFKNRKGSWGPGSFDTLIQDPYPYEQLRSITWRAIESYLAEGVVAVKALPPTTGPTTFTVFGLRAEYEQKVNILAHQILSTTRTTASPALKVDAAPVRSAVSWTRGPVLGGLLRAYVDGIEARLDKLTSPNGHRDSESLHETTQLLVALGEIPSAALRQLRRQKERG
ncbi:MAG: hypothetical protein M3T49_06290, partial [Candidatus Eremiobacteraeota bacterium]|nr:hypothetical protein [Candidatus Eremiobacteraeota bacterium]